MLEFEQLYTNPSPNLTLTLACYQLIFVGLGKGRLVRSCSDTNIDPICSLNRREAPNTSGLLRSPSPCYDRFQAWILSV